jgi:myo-inositol-1(or 4)-monophosphatase
MQQYSPLITVMMQAVRKASRLVARDYGEVANLQVSRKGTTDFVTSADLRVEALLKEELMHARPKFGMLSEESPEIKGEDPTQRWIIDPIDGTHNFIHSLPYFCINIAVEQTLPNGHKEVLAAMTHAPILGETYWAEKGRGAWLESRNRHDSGRMRVANRSDLTQSLVMTGSLKQGLDNVKKLSSQTQGVRCIGSSALSLAYMAAGRCDVFVQDSAHLWDVAAGVLLVKEAGGVVGHLHKGDFKLQESASILAGNEILVSKVQKILQPEQK